MKQCNSLSCLFRANFTPLVLVFLYLVTLSVALHLMHTKGLENTLEWVKDLTGSWALAIATSLKATPSHDAHDGSIVASTSTTSTETATSTANKV